jgi:hypothetical protein
VWQSCGVERGYELLGDGDDVARLPVAVAPAGLSKTHWADGDRPGECNHGSGTDYEATHSGPVHEVLLIFDVLDREPIGELTDLSTSKRRSITPKLTPRGLEVVTT